MTRSRQADMTENYDPITAEVINMAMQEIVTEMGVTVERTSGSPAATDAKDYSCVLAHVNGDTIAYYGNNLQHVGDSLTGSRALVEAFDLDDINDGDVFIYNDPYSTGSLHQCDVALQEPIFHEGHLIGWVFTNIHMGDIGGMSPSGFTPESRDVYAEGLRLPPMRIVEAGRDNRSLWALIEANVRTSLVLGDIRSAISACNVGRRRFEEVCSTYGPDELQKNLKVNERLVADVLRRRIQSIPPGRYEARDWVEYDPFEVAEYVPIHCILEVRPEGVLKFDYSASGEQVAGYANGSSGGILGSVISVVLAALLPDLPVNAGVHECLEVEVGAEGLITNPLVPAGVSGGHMETGPRCLRAAHRALSMAMLISEDDWVRGRCYAPGGITAGMLVLTGHLTGGGRGYAFMLDQQALGHGALPGRDGVAFGGIDYSIAGREPDVEATEASGPVLYLWRREIADSGGAGEFRGGNTLETMFIPWGVDHAELSQACAGGVIPTQGVAGGYPGGGSYTEIHRGLLPLTIERLPGKEDVTGPGELIRSKTGRVDVGARDAVRQLMAAGAGWGDPVRRDPSLVAEDVAQQRISADSAERAFGVKLRPDGSVDETATADLRAGILQARGHGGAAQERQGGTVFPTFVDEMGAVQCGHCTRPLGDSPSLWRSGAQTSITDLASALESRGTPVVRSGQAFVLIEYTCPGCGTLLDTVVAHHEHDAVVSS